MRPGVRGRRVRCALAVAAGAVLLGAAGAGAVPPGSSTAPAAPRAAAAEGADCAETDPETPTDPITGRNESFESMHVGAAQDLVERRTGADPGAGVTVAIVDAGVADLPDVSHEQLPSSSQTDLLSSHATVIAGIIGGPDQSGGDGGDQIPIGIAPGARVVDVRVYDRPRGGEDQEGEPPSTSGIVAGLRRVLDAGFGPKVIAVVPVAVAESPELKDVVADLARAGVLVIAAAGDRPADGEDALLGEYAHPDGVPPGEDAADDVWPAGYPSVLAVTAVDPDGEDLSSVVLQNSATDLAAPTAGGVSYGLNREPCVVVAYSSDWATAQVAGVAALVWSATGREKAAQLRQRLLRTADGSGAPDSKVTGYGVVQPVEALERLTPRAGAGAPRAESVGRAPAPPERADLLADVRRDAVWWGLLGGGALVIAVLLRPVLSRRRR